MKTIKGQPIAQDGNDALFPDGQIRDKTLTQAGTPVVRGVYGDVLTNIYAILRDAGIEPNQQEDSETNGYQLLDALKVFVNDLNDIQQLLTVSDDEINTTFNFDNLPDNYIFFGKVTESLVFGDDYTLKSGDEGTASYPVTIVADIDASSIVMVVLNESGTNLFNLTSLFAQASEEVINTPFGTPLGFNELKKVLYLSSGYILSDLPESFAVQNSIRVYASDGNINVIDAIVHKKKLICLTYNDMTFEYKIFCFNASDMNTVVGEVPFQVSNVTNNQPYMYCDGEYVYFTNSTSDANDSPNDFDIAKFYFSDIPLSLSYAGSFSIENTFEKTTNVFFDKSLNCLYTFVSGQLAKYNIATSTKTDIGVFNTIDGAVFKLNNNTYYTNGGVATKWMY